MKKITKGKIYRQIKDFPGLHLLYRFYTEQKIARNYQKKDREGVFVTIFEENKWNDAESVSGPGSNNIQTAKIIVELPKLFEKYDVKSILDAPCGDFNWMRNVDLSGIEYVGGDIVPTLVERNNQRYRTIHQHFIPLDITNTPLPPVQLIMVRDCLVHFSYKDIRAFLGNLKKSKVEYLLTTNFEQTRFNYNITTGNWRAINFLKKPFCFPPPLAIINEDCTESYGQYTDKSLYLWKVKDLPL